MVETSTPPSFESIKTIQLFRSTIAAFLSWNKFVEAVVGCYVRVLLELNTNSEGGERYYIARVKGARRGGRYSGFSGDNTTTDWHIEIDLPPCFQGSPNASIVQINSISNSPFRSSEYQVWMDLSYESKNGFPSVAQIEFRRGVLQDHIRQATLAELHHLEKTPEFARQKSTMEKEINATYAKLPLVSKLDQLSRQKLEQLETDVIQLLNNISRTLEEKSRCIQCRDQHATVVMWPCKHQVLCKACATRTPTHCPVPGCGQVVEKTFVPFD